jgi:uncharacterized protein (DUF488 family)
MPPTVWTVGHSTRSFDELAEVLAAHQIEAILDVRRFPGSRRLPQFGRDALEPALARVGIHYRWIPELGGRRRAAGALGESRWRNAAFASYAEHVQGEEFAVGLQELLTVAGGLRTALMCAEVLWWRCHRRLIADVLTALGYGVLHLRTTAEGELHRIAEPARLVRGKLSYR